MRCYLDYNATAPVRSDVVAAMVETLRETGNPSSTHGEGRAARRRVETARAQVAALAGCLPSAVVFTSSGTEANNLALGGARVAARLVSAIEHDSVLVTAATLPGAFDVVPVRPTGVIDLEALQAELAAAPRPALVSVMLVNNETGVIQPVAEVARIARDFGALVHCDAVQGAGRIPLTKITGGVDYLTLSAHKLGGPQGMGALVLRSGLPFTAQMRGGAQESRRRAGTENVAGIVGFGVAAEAALAELAFQSALGALRDRLQAAITAACPRARVFGGEAPRVTNTCCLSMPGVKAETQLMALDLAGIAASAGAACSSGKITASHVLMAMGVTQAEARTALRFSLGWASTQRDVDQTVSAWMDLWQRTATPAEVLVP